MPTPNQISNLPFENNLVLNSLNKDDKTAMVYDLSNGYNTLDTLMSMIQKGKSTQVVGLDGKIQKPLYGRSRVIAQIASNSASGSNLIVNFNDPTYNLFRVGDTVMDSSANNIKGRVIAKQPGQITLQLAPNAGVSSWNASVHFIAGMYAKALFDSSVNRGSGGKETLYEFPSYDYNFTAVTRETVEIFRNDMAQTWVEFQGKYWWSAQDQIAVQRMARSCEYKYWFSERGQINDAGGSGQINYNGGLKWAIKDPVRGGVYRPLTNAMTQGDFETFLADIGNLQTNPTVPLTLLMGRGALQTIQSFGSISNSIQYSGQTNTFGGSSVEGLNVMQYSIAGVKCNFILAPIFNDTQFFPEASTIPGVNGTRMSNTIVAIDPSNYEVLGGGMRPAMEKIYFGDEEYIYGYIPGLIGNGARTKSNVFTSGDVLAVNSRDAVTLEIYTNSGIDVIANKMGWMELAY